MWLLQCQWDSGNQKAYRHIVRGWSWWMAAGQSTAPRDMQCIVPCSPSGWQYPIFWHFGHLLNLTNPKPRKYSSHGGQWTSKCLISNALPSINLYLKKINLYFMNREQVWVCSTWEDRATNSVWHSVKPGKEGFRRLQPRLALHSTRIYRWEGRGISVWGKLQL